MIDFLKDAVKNPKRLSKPNVTLEIQPQTTVPDGEILPPFKMRLTTHEEIKSASLSVHLWGVKYEKYTTKEPTIARVQTGPDSWRSVSIMADRTHFNEITLGNEDKSLAENQTFPAGITKEWNVCFETAFKRDAEWKLQVSLEVADRRSLNEEVKLSVA